MLYTSPEPPIVKSGGKMKNPADEIILAKSALVFYNPKNFDSSNGMLDPDASPGYFGVGRLLLPGKFFSLRFLCRLHHGDVIGTVALVSGILPKDAFIREGIHFIGDALVVHLSLNSETGKENKSCHTGDYGILDGVFPLFAAIVLLLKIRVGRSWNLALGPVMNEFMYDSVAASLVKKFSKSQDIGSRKHPRVVDCVAEYLRQGVDPLPALLLAHVKTCRMIALKRVVLQIYKYEKQPFGNSGKRTVGLHDVGTASGKFSSLHVVPPKVFVMRFSEKRQNFVKKGYADTCECQKSLRIIPCFSIVHPFINVFCLARTSVNITI